jgi:hypothetical protein
MKEKIVDKHRLQLILKLKSVFNPKSGPYIDKSFFKSIMNQIDKTSAQNFNQSISLTILWGIEISESKEV